MRATLIDYTGAGFTDPYHAADILIFAKNTRVQLSPSLFKDIQGWSKERKDEELAYIANTIPGSWEMVHYTFLLEEVTRSFTHQLVRTRTASYAQQTMQILDVRGFTYKTGATLTKEMRTEYDRVMASIQDFYSRAIDQGCKVADAREILPTGIHTNIIMKANLRTLVDLFHSRISSRNLDEFREVCVLMRECMMTTHPWTKFFLERTVDTATRELEQLIRQHAPGEAMSPGTPMNVMLKLVDQLRRKG